MKRNLLITGGTGLIGAALIRQLLLKDTYRITILSRNPEKHRGKFPDQVHWIGSLDEISSEDHFAIVVNLAGEGIGGKRWSEKQKRRIFDSRVAFTRALVSKLKALPKAPELMINGSAIGYYGSQDDRLLTETSPHHDEFTHRLCHDWEAAAKEIESLGTRLCCIRTAIVLDKNRGALPQMLLPFKLFVGGRIGNGKQYMSWIHLQDEIRAIDFLIQHEECRGAYNLSSPNAVTNAAFAKTVGNVLKRPSFFPLPGFVVKLLFGEMGEALLLSGQRVSPSRLLEAGFEFQHPELKEALKSLL
jgi:uncharacterized protein (TIGR01777 family)